MKDNLVVIQAPRGGPLRKGCSSTSLPQNNYDEEMQSSLGIDGEGQPLKE